MQRKIKILDPRKSGFMKTTTYSFLFELWVCESIFSTDNIVAINSLSIDWIALVTESFGSSYQEFSSMCTRRTRKYTRGHDIKVGLLPNNKDLTNCAVDFSNQRSHVENGEGQRRGKKEVHINPGPGDNSDFPYLPRPSCACTHVCVCCVVSPLWIVKEK